MTLWNLRSGIKGFEYEIIQDRCILSIYKARHKPINKTSFLPLFHHFLVNNSIKDLSKVKANRYIVLKSFKTTYLSVFPFKRI